MHRIQLAIPPGTQQRVRAFYRDVLGMTEIPAPDAPGDTAGPAAGPARAAGQAAEEAGTSVQAFRSGDVVLELRADPAEPPPQTAHPGVLVPDIDTLAGQLAARGVTVEWDYKFPGYRRFYVRDPLGNRLAFLSPAPTTAGRP